MDINKINTLSENTANCGSLAERGLSVNYPRLACV